jgi:hypothetical protein
VSQAETVSIRVPGLASGAYTRFVLDATTLPTQGTALSFSNGTITYALHALSLVAFDIPAPDQTPPQRPKNLHRR